MELHYNHIMLVSHESPIDMLYDSHSYNDYDYALVHLFETHPDYYSFFKSSLTLGREVLLDNSIFELKEAFDADKFAAYIEDLKPTYYVVPDVLEDAEGTMKAWLKFQQKYSDLPGMKIGVVQGKTYQDLVECYKFMSDRADYIAISFDYSWYQQVGIAYTHDEKLAKLERQCTGRQQLYRRLKEDKIWRDNKPHHLLGCSLAKEFAQYTWDYSVRSCDTSNPVVAGIKGLRYISGIGLLEKPSTLLADLIDHNTTDDQRQDIIYNTTEFKKLIGRRS